MSAADDALDVARFCQDDENGAAMFHIGLVSVDDGIRRHCIAAAERVLVERGLGFRYGVVLLEELGLADKGWPEDVAAAIRTAPLEVCLRALARVVREKQQKEKHT